MRIPLKPKPLVDLLEEVSQNQAEFFSAISETNPTPNGKYLHWDKLRHMSPPGGITHEQWWLRTKLGRQALMKPIPLDDIRGKHFTFAMVDPVQRLVHQIDRDASGRIEISEEVTNPNTRDRYIINSLIEEAITSSQLEGASTTSAVAKEMIRTGRRPTDRSEQMILNNFEVMRQVRELKQTKLTPDHILRLHRIVSEDAMDDPSAAGRLRTSHDGDIFVVDPYDGKVLHRPPPPDSLPDRLVAFCDFANGSSTEDVFIHPVVRAIMIHFWIGYDHPFVDGNGRTARALFYWSMLSQGYWLAEFISISRILRNAPAQYARSYLLTETDDNDATYFLLHQLSVIRLAIRDLHKYLARKVAEVRNTESLIRHSADLNHRQLALLTHALKDPDARYAIASHQKSHSIVYETARSDLLDLVDKNLLMKRKVGRAFFFFPPQDLQEQIREFGR